MPRTPLNQYDDVAVAYLDKNAKVARVVAWCAAGVDAVYAATALVTGGLIGGRVIAAAVLGVSAVAIAWLLIKSRPAAAS